LTLTRPELLEAEAGAARIWCSDRRGGASTGPCRSCNIGDHVGDDPAAVAENRARVAAAAGLRPPSEWVWLDQVHGAVVHVADGVPEDVPAADAAVTSTPGLPLVVVTADCAPVVIACDDAIGVVHAGHRGLLAGVVERAVTQLGAMGLGPVRAFLGPCVRPAQYEFGADDLAGLVDHFGTEVASTTSDGRPAFDIPTAVRIALLRAGVAPDDISDSDICTASSTDMFSYRRDGTTGRQATIAVLM
jgi:purine-nucleoside/S-methyl-5'-thioadenosine phosphorylase / adenosine deaminase